MFNTEMWGDALVVFSDTRNNSDGEPLILGMASAKVTNLSGQRLIKADLEIRPSCKAAEIASVQKMLLDYITQTIGE